MKAFPNTYSEPTVTRYSDFKELIRDWNVSEHFKYRMKQAIVSKDKVAEFEPELLTKRDIKFMTHHGYELNTESMTTEV